MYIFYAPDFTENSVFSLSENESHHATHVLRLQAGDGIKIVNGKGKIANATILSVHKKHCTIEVSEIRIEPKEFSCSLHIAIAPVKSMDRFEWFLEKACEWGVDDITPIISENSERVKLNMQKCEATLIAALKQSGRAWKPVIHPMIKFSEFMKNNTLVDAANVIAYCGNIKKEMLLYTISKLQNVNVLIGPEGDFSIREIELAMANNWLPVTLGNYRLRTETAALESAVIYNLVNRL